METLCKVVVIVVQNKWKVYQMDVKSTFLNGVLKEKVYVVQPPGYEVEGKEDKVYRLRKALYGLKQAPHACYNKIDAYLLDNGINKCDRAPTLYIKESMCLVSSFMETPKETHWQETKRIQRYINGTKQYAILYTAIDDFRLVGYTNSDWAGSVNERRSTSGYVFHLGSGAISSASKNQLIVSLSTTEVEYLSATTTTCQAVWMRRMLRDLHHDQGGMRSNFYDNISTIALSKNYVFHKRTKHIDAKYHFIMEFINNDEIVL
eukprot:PITA_34119